MFYRGWECPYDMTESDRHAEHSIHMAAEAGRVRRVRAMLDADPSQLERRDRDGASPLHRASIPTTSSGSTKTMKSCAA